MLSSDQFSQWLGIQVVEERQGFCKLTMTVRQEMLNGFGIAHGGITYSLADSALAFVANTAEKQAISIETSISHLKILQAGEVITAAAIEKSVTPHIGVYEVVIKNGEGEIAALFKGTVYRRDKK